MPIDSKYNNIYKFNISNEQIISKFNFDIKNYEKPILICNLRCNYDLQYNKVNKVELQKLNLYNTIKNDKNYYLNVLRLNIDNLKDNKIFFNGNKNNVEYHLTDILIYGSPKHKLANFEHKLEMHLIHQANDADKSQLVICVPLHDETTSTEYDSIQRSFFKLLTKNLNNSKPDINTFYIHKTTFKSNNKNIKFKLNHVLPTDSSFYYYTNDVGVEFIVFKNYSPIPNTLLTFFDKHIAQNKLTYIIKSNEYDINNVSIYFNKNIDNNFNIKIDPLTYKDIVKSNNIFTIKNKNRKNMIKDLTCLIFILLVFMIVIMLYKKFHPTIIKDFMKNISNN